MATSGSISSSACSRKSGLRRSPERAACCEAVDLLAALADDFHAAGERAVRLAYAILDGTLVPIDRVTNQKPYYSGRHHRHGVNVQILADPAGRLVRASAALPGVVHDLTAARAHGVAVGLADGPRAPAASASGPDRSSGERVLGPVIRQRSRSAQTSIKRSRTKSFGRTINTSRITSFRMFRHRHERTASARARPAAWEQHCGSRSLRTVGPVYQFRHADLQDHLRVLT